VRILAGAAAAAAALLALAAPPAQALPACPEHAAVLHLLAPEFTHVDSGIELQLRTAAPERVSNAVVRLQSRGDAQTVPVTLGGGRTRVILESGSAKDLTASVGVEWDQDAQDPLAACHGSATQPLPNLPAGASAGDPRVPRFNGPFAVRGGRGKRRFHERWWMTPRCDYFGCRSWLGTTPLSFVPDSTGAYRLYERRGRILTCSVRWRRGFGPWKTKVIPRAWRLTVEYVVRPTRVRNGLIRAFRGRIFYFLEPTRYAARWNCLPATVADPLRGRRITG
jgi:hypothetical protein